MDNFQNEMRGSKIIIILLDILLLLGSYIIGILLKFGEVWHHPVYQDLKPLFPALIAIGIFLIYTYGLYNIMIKPYTEVMFSIFLTVLLLALITILYTFLSDYFIYSRYVVIYAGILQFVFLALLRFIVLSYEKKKHGKKPMLIIGNFDESANVARKIFLSLKGLYEIKYLLDINQSKVKLLYLIKDVSYIVICSRLSEKDKAEIISICSMYNKQVYLIPELYDISIKNTKLYQFDDIPVFFLKDLGLSNEEKHIKRIFDICFTLITLIVLSPIFMFVAIATKLDSNGPIFFKQERITEGNKKFHVIKFRTMVLNAEESTGPILAEESDTRVTRFGAFLRRSRLDELPQLINVLKGEMSIVGPRPERLFFINQFIEDIPEFEYRVTVKAGITGLAQVLGKYSTSAEDKLRYDMLYIRNFSILQDIKIILQTIKILFFKNHSKGIENQISFFELLEKHGYKVIKRDSYIKIQKKG